MAFPLYPELKSEVEKMLLNFFEQKAREELGPFRDVRRFSVHEGRKLVHNTLDNQEYRRDMAYEVGSVEFAISHEEMAAMVVDDVRALLEEKAKEFGAQQAQHGYRVLDQVTAETGNVIDAGGKPLTVDLFLETIRKISIAFDKFGNPQMPTIVIHPSMAEKYRTLLEEANNDEETKRRLNEILTQKKGEYDAEQARRKLVD